MRRMHQENHERVRKKPFLRAVAFLLVMVLLYSISGSQTAVLISGIWDRVQNLGGERSADQQEQPAEDFEAILEKADAAIDQGNYDDALTYIAQCEAAAGEADSARMFTLHLQQASIYIVREQYQEAEEALDKALAQDPQSTQALLLRAQAALGQGNHTLAVEDLQKCLELEPENVSLWISLAQVYEGMNFYSEAGGCYDQICTLLPEEDIYQLSALRCVLLSGDYEGALSGLDSYIDRWTAQPGSGGEVESAIPLHSAAPSAEQENDAAELLGTAYFLRGCCQMQRFDFAAAVTDLESAIASGYDEASALEQLVACAYVLGNHEEALAYGERLTAIPEADFARGSVYQQMGLSAVALERHEEAVSYLGKSILFDPSLTGNHYYRGMSLLALGRYEEAAADFTDSIAEGYLTQFCCYNRGVCYVQMLDYEKALADMKQVSSIADDQTILEAAAEVQAQLEDYFANQEAQTNPLP